MSHLKLIDRLLRGDCPAYGTMLNEELWHELPVVLANEPAQLYFRLSARDTTPTYNHGMGPLLPPWPAWWTEWSLPLDIPYTPEGDKLGDLGSAVRGLQAGTLARAMECSDGWLIKMTPFIGNSRNVVHVPLSYEIPVDRAGRWAGLVGADGHPQVNTTVLVEDNPIKVYDIHGHTAMHIVKVAMSTLGFMNTKNVELLDMEHSGPVTKSRTKRSGFKPITSWSIIRLPRPARTTSNRQEAKEALGEDLPAHVVMGHFKSYSEEHKLFGRHIGSYWWPAFVRGNPGRGKIKRIVEVGVE